MVCICCSGAQWAFQFFGIAICGLHIFVCLSVCPSVCKCLPPQETVNAVTINRLVSLPSPPLPFPPLPSSLYLKVEEMKDEYDLKLKLREGAFNLAAALSSQEGKASKEKLTEARAEQKDLMEDLCDIEDELETKLGVFRVNVRGECYK